MSLLLFIPTLLRLPPAACQWQSSLPQNCHWPANDQSDNHSDIAWSYQTAVNLFAARQPLTSQPCLHTYQQQNGHWPGTALSLASGRTAAGQLQCCCWSAAEQSLASYTDDVSAVTDELQNSHWPAIEQSLVSYSTVIGQLQNSHWPATEQSLASYRTVTGQLQPLARYRTTGQLQNNHGLLLSLSLLF